MILPELKGKGVFVFSDPGGAKPVLALAESLRNKLTSYNIISDRDYSFAEDFSVDVDHNFDDPVKVLKDQQADFLFTGTSYTSSIEYNFIEAAAELKIPSYAFVDHRTSIKERFIRDEKEVLPDIILLAEEGALKIAEQQGIDKNKLIVFGNPYHDFLKSWKPKISKEEFLKTIGSNVGDRKIILYAPDPLSNVDGKTKFGFDEISATEQLKNAASALKNDFIFLLLAHPNQNRDRLKDFLGDQIILLPENIHVNEAILYVDAVVGFFSNILIEADILQKSIIRFLPKSFIVDPLANMNIGKIVNEETLAQTLINLK